jgi:hypothetical protein
MDTLGFILSILSCVLVISTWWYGLLYYKYRSLYNVAKKNSSADEIIAEFVDTLHPRPIPAVSEHHPLNDMLDALRSMSKLQDKYRVHAATVIALAPDVFNKVDEAINSGEILKSSLKYTNIERVGEGTRSLSIQAYGKLFHILDGSASETKRLLPHWFVGNNPNLKQNKDES